MQSGFHSDLEGNLGVYYERFFPFKQIVNWLNYESKGNDYFKKREISCTLLNDSCIRFLSFDDENDFRAKIIRLNPAKMDFGAVYSAKPCDKKSLDASAFKPLEKELVIDIDLTDYDDVRTCCNEANICGKCWKFVTAAVKVIDRSLSEDFGFNHRLWVYSGRRGIHCWICDEKARNMSAQARKAVISYLEVVKGGGEKIKKVNVNGGHPFIQNSIAILEPMFVPNIIVEQEMLTEANQEKIFQLLPNEKIRNALRKDFERKKKLGPAEKWNEICAYLDGHQKRDIIFQLMYPRLDVNVSIGLNHLLKSPFCVHPKTGRVCVPIDPSKIDAFDPFAVPKVQQLLMEIDQYEDAEGVKENSNSSIPDYKKTSLRPYLEYFNSFLAKLRASLHQSTKLGESNQDLF